MSLSLSSPPSASTERSPSSRRLVRYTSCSIHDHLLRMVPGTSSFENSTGGYEYDISLAGDFSKAYREMHPRTDVFCGASIVLPDRAGRQINVGGWSLVSTFGIRLYAPGTFFTSAIHPCSTLNLCDLRWRSWRERNQRLGGRAG